MREYSNDILERLEHMRVLQEQARTITLPLFYEGMQVENKAETGYDPVTQADTEAEQLLRDLIQRKFPDDAIMGEEFDDIEGTSDWLWTLDPIDGTRGFVAGVPVWSTLIAVSYLGKPLLGLIDLPALDTSFWGEPGHAWREDPRGKTDIETRPCGQINDAIMGCTEPLSMLNSGELAAYNIIRAAARFSRLGLDALGYGLVASGRMDLIIEADLKPCDTRALIPIIEGAGGKITDWHGGSCVDGGRVVAVGDPKLLPELYIYLGRAMNLSGYR
ncbi:MAG: histidinol-phosphatase [Hellea sp.]|nr:histidinol-phosphatase [Hellea sp.]